MGALGSKAFLKASTCQTSPAEPRSSGVDRRPNPEVVRGCTEQLSRAMRRRCNVSSKLEQIWNSRTRLLFARGPWSLYESVEGPVVINSPTLASWEKRGSQRRNFAFHIRPWTPTTIRNMRNKPASSELIQHLCYCGVHVCLYQCIGSSLVLLPRMFSKK